MALTNFNRSNYNFIIYWPIQICHSEVLLYESSSSYSDGVDVRRRVFVAAEIDDDPSDVPQKRDRNRRVDERQERLDDAQRNAVISTLWTVSDNVAYKEEDIKH